jgi:predicted ferric reductase
MIGNDVILAALGSDIAIAGLVLVFVGFVSAKAESYQGDKSGDKFHWLAVSGFIPILVSLIAAWMCVDALQYHVWEANHTLMMLKVVLVLLGIYTISSAVIFLP